MLVGCAPETMQNIETFVVESLRAFLVLFWGRWEVGYFFGRCIFFFLRMGDTKFSQQCKITLNKQVLVVICLSSFICNLLSHASLPFGFPFVTLLDSLTIIPTLSFASS